jgi:hypothetical protein
MNNDGAFGGWGSVSRARQVDSEIWPLLWFSLLSMLFSIPGGNDITDHASRGSYTEQIAVLPLPVSLSH